MGSKNQKNQQATLCLLVKDKKVLLAMKKRGLGEGKWNGAGGKVENGESIKQAAVRETKEELGVVVKSEDLVEKAKLHFKFPKDKSGWDEDVHVFLCKKWEGKPRESEEMKPNWFSYQEIPFNEMWDGDHLWMSRVIAGENLECWIEFDEDNKAINHRIKPSKKAS